MQAAQRHTANIDEEYTLPRMEALLAGTMALMTGYAQSARDCPQRVPMARKLISNLLYLSSHPQLSPPMRTMVANLCTRWQLELENAAAEVTVSQRGPTPLWHSAPDRVQ